MASVHNIGLNGQKIDAENEHQASSRPVGMARDSGSSPLQTKDSYWFAHGGTDNLPISAQQDSRHGGEREEKARLFREQLEGERRRRLQDLEEQFLAAKRHREQQEEERRRRIEEARLREAERRQQVEERKRQIWEAEQERKEAILRRNMEREARIEARRNAQRNSQCFAFGSSTPRTFDLDLAALGAGGRSLLMAAVPRKSEEAGPPPPRATSACSLDRKTGEDCSMSRSMISLSTSSTFRGRKRTDITPTLSRERSVTPHLSSHRGNPAQRAVSMTRLDQLAQPRRTYLSPPTPTTLGPQPTSPGMSKSMLNLAGGRKSPRRAPPAAGDMSRSMLHLAGGEGRPPPPGRGALRPARSMMHLAPPRLTKTARLRALGARSTWNLNSPQSFNHLSPGSKDASRSPSRPQSSMSVTSDLSASSSSASAAVRLRAAPPRRPRPYSVHGTVVDGSSVSGTASSRREPDRPARMHERNVSAPKPSTRAKSASRESARKPVPPPKPSDVLSRTKAGPVPTKDNLRKVGKSASNPISIKDHKEVTQKRQDPAAEPETIEAPSPDSCIDSEEAAPQQTDSGHVSAEEVPAEEAARPKIASEEEARVALAEKRRLAREQAEREAEAERIRLEEMRRAEEERRLREEEEQRRAEEEQIRLAELHRRLEEEKLARAIQEQEQKEKEESARREEEAMARAEREEAERRAREEAERQRAELEEKLRKEEEERAERKKRVEQIMARTRGKSAAQSPVTPCSEGGRPDLLNGCNGNAARTDEPRTNGRLADAAPASNGYSSPEEEAMSCTTSPEELLIDLQDCQPSSRGESGDLNSNLLDNGGDAPLLDLLS